jgi:hypothetical protein
MAFEASLDRLIKRLLVYADTVPRIKQRNPWPSRTAHDIKQNFGEDIW